MHFKQAVNASTSPLCEARVNYHFPHTTHMLKNKHSNVKHWQRCSRRTMNVCLRQTRPIVWSSLQAIENAIHLIDLMNKLLPAFFSYTEKAKMGGHPSLWFPGHRDKANSTSCHFFALVSIGVINFLRMFLEAAVCIYPQAAFENSADGDWSKPHQQNSNINSLEGSATNLYATKLEWTVLETSRDNTYIRKMTICQSHKHIQS